MTEPPEEAIPDIYADDEILYGLYQAASTDRAARGPLGDRLEELGDSFAAQLARVGHLVESMVMLQTTDPVQRSGLLRHYLIDWRFRA